MLGQEILLRFHTSANEKKKKKKMKFSVKYFTKKMTN